MRMDYSSVLESLKGIVKEQISILDSYGACMVSSDSTILGKVLELPGDLDTIKKQDGYLYLNLTGAFDSPVLRVEHMSDESVRLIQLIRLMVVNQYVKKDKEDYLLKALMGPLSEGELQYVEEENFFSFHKSEFRVVAFDVKSVDTDAVLFIGKQLFDDEILLVNGDYLILITSSGFDDLYGKIVMFLTEVDSEIMSSVKSAIGKVSIGFDKIHEAYRSALRTFDLGKLLHEDKSILYYEQLMIPFMLDAIDAEVIESLISPIEDEIDNVFEDDELVMTMTQFFLNDLNITETARNLFVHRNTLIYRLSKIEKLTGLDLKRFEDAVKLYLILYIKKIS